MSSSRWLLWVLLPMAADTGRAVQRSTARPTESCLPSGRLSRRHWNVILATAMSHQLHFNRWKEEPTLWNWLLKNWWPDTGCEVLGSLLSCLSEASRSSCSRLLSLCGGCCRRMSSLLWHTFTRLLLPTAALMLIKFMTTMVLLPMSGSLAGVFCFYLPFWQHCRTERNPLCLKGVLLS